MVDAHHDIFAALHKATTKIPQVKIVIGQEQCVDCLLGKIRRLSFPQNLSQRVTQLLDIVHVDLCGLMTVTSVRGNKYNMICIDIISHTGETLASLQSKVTLLEHFC